MKDTLLQALKLNTIEIFDKMMNAEVEAGEITSENITHPLDFAGRIDIIQGNDAVGSISLYLSMETAEYIVQGMTGDLPEESKQVIIDTVKEIVNIIANRTKAYLKEIDEGLSFSFPAVVTEGIENNNEVSIDGKERCFIPFSMGGHQFCVEVRM